MTTTRALLLTVALLLPACGARPDRVERRDHLPRALVALEAMSEHAYERALAGDVAAVTSASTRLLDDWTSLRGEANRRGAEDDLLVELDAAVLRLGDVARSSTDPIVLGRAANRITGSLDELFALYDPTVASAVMELDYLGRELALDGMAADMHHAGTHVSMLDDRWIALRPELELAGGAVPVAALGDAVAATRAAVTSRDADALEARASALVDSVYVVEGDLERR